MGKGRKINKEKLKAVLATIDCFEDEDMKEANFDPPGTQQNPSPSIPGRSCASVVRDSLQHYLSPVARNKISLSDYDSDVSSVAGVYSASDGSSDFNDLSNMNDSIFCWESYYYFAQFCGKLGINLCDHKER